MIAINATNGSSVVSTVAISVESWIKASLILVLENADIVDWLIS
jgi:hypothetical protein